MLSGEEEEAPVRLPRVTIQFCIQCKWMLRAAYYAQELLSTFSTSLGEVALIPATGGVFTIDLMHSLKKEPGGDHADVQMQKSTRLWDRKSQGGFPETKQLKKLVRDIVELERSNPVPSPEQPDRDLGHVDRSKTVGENDIPTSRQKPVQSSASQQRPRENAVGTSSPDDKEAGGPGPGPTAGEREGIGSETGSDERPTMDHSSKETGSVRLEGCEDCTR